MPDELLTKEQLADGLALHRLTSDKEIWPAVERLFRRMNDDLIRKWSEDETVKRQYVKGGRAVLDMLMENIKASAAVAEEYKETEREAQQSLRSVAEDGMGSGDLAI